MFWVFGKFQLADTMIRKRLICILSSLILGISLVTFFYLTAAPVLLWVCGALVLLGLGEGLFLSPNMSLIMSGIQKGKEGGASAIMTTLRSIAQLLGLALFEAIFSEWVPGSPAAATIVQAGAAFRALFLFGAG